MHFAARLGQLEALKALVELGADMQVLDAQGLTPVRWCVPGARGYEPSEKHQACARALGFLLNLERQEMVPLSEEELARQQAQPKCAACGGTEPKLKRCARCMKVKYCSGACQKSHWPTHKGVCVALQKP